jgi:hypothetical protein
MCSLILKETTVRFSETSVYYKLTAWGYLTKCSTPQQAMRFEGINIKWVETEEDFAKGPMICEVEEALLPTA